MSFTSNHHVRKICIVNAQQCVNLDCQEPLTVDFLNQLISLLNINHLYVVGDQAYNYLRSYGNLLHVYEITLDSNDKLKFPCTHCGKKDCIYTKACLGLRRSIKRFIFNVDN